MRKKFYNDKLFEKIQLYRRRIILYNGIDKNILKKLFSLKKIYYFRKNNSIFFIHLSSKFKKSNRKFLFSDSASKSTLNLKQKILVNLFFQKNSVFYFVLFIFFLSMYNIYIHI